LKRAQREDEEEDARLGPGGKNEDLPEELKRRQTRLAKIRKPRQRWKPRPERKQKKRLGARGRPWGRRWAGAGGGEASREGAT